MGKNPEIYYALLNKLVFYVRPYPFIDTNAFFVFSQNREYAAIVFDMNPAYP
jgi:hypothetical protein